MLPASGHKRSMRQQSRMVSDGPITDTAWAGRPLAITGLGDLAILPSERLLLTIIIVGLAVLVSRLLLLLLWVG